MTITLGQDPFANFPLGFNNPQGVRRAIALAPDPDFSKFMITKTEPTLGVQYCPLGKDSTDSLIPGVCNTTTLALAVVFIGFMMFMGSGGQR